MHVLEKSFIDLFRNHLPLENSKIFTGSRYISRDITPCVTILLADESFIRRRYIEMDNIQYIQKRFNAELWVNVWCQTEEQRQELIESINARILQAESNHYTTCSHYLEGNICAETNNPCEALTLNTGRTVKNQCPNLEIYQSFFKQNHIPKRTFHINSVINMDELDISETLLRTIFKLSMDYLSYHTIGGKTIEDLTILEEVL